MRIGFDVSQTAEAMAGCGIFAHELFTQLVRVAPEHTFLPYPVFEGYRHPEFKKATRPDAPNVDDAHHGQSWRALNAGWDAPGDRHAFLGAPDIVHSNSFASPRRLGAPLVYTVYDLSPLEHPEYHTEANRLVCFNGMFDAARQARAFIAISSYTRARFLRWFPFVPASRVHVVPLGARTSVVCDVSTSDARAVLETFDLRSGAFWLAVGTIEPRKNYPLLLDAYARICAEHPDTPPLCIAGQAGWKESSLEARIRGLGLTERVRCLGFVPDAALAVLYAHCHAFVFPSRYEGFGLPVIEAMACGAAVIASHTSSLPEVVGEAGLLIDPASVESLVAAMRLITVKPDVRLRLKSAARRHATGFSWKRAARHTLAVYDEIAAPAAGRAAAQAPAPAADAPQPAESLSMMRR